MMDYPDPDAHHQAEGYPGSQEADGSRQEAGTRIRIAYCNREHLIDPEK
jgi:hypothetical protein